MNEKNAAQFDCWCVVEIFGHQRVAGRVTETTVAGGPFLRVDVPETSDTPAYTRYYSPQAVYSFAPVTEEVARGLAEAIRARPVQVYELPKLRAPAVEDRSDCCRRCHRRTVDQTETGLCLDCADQEEDHEYDSHDDGED